jgi:hypothetical protein
VGGADQFGSAADVLGTKVFPDSMAAKPATGLIA